MDWTGKGSNDIGRLSLSACRRRHILQVRDPNNIASVFESIEKTTQRESENVDLVSRATIIRVRLENADFGNFAFTVSVTEHNKQAWRRILIYSSRHQFSDELKDAVNRFGCVNSLEVLVSMMVVLFLSAVSSCPRVGRCCAKSAD